jgi:hypothetical protein
MMAPTGTILCGLAVLAVAFEATAAAAVFGVLGFWFISHGVAIRGTQAHNGPAQALVNRTGPLSFTGPHFGRPDLGIFKIHGLKLPPLPR